MSLSTRAWRLCGGGGKSKLSVDSVKAGCLRVRAKMASGSADGVEKKVWSGRGCVHCLD